MFSRKLHRRGVLPGILGLDKGKVSRQLPGILGLDKGKVSRQLPAPGMEGKSIPEILRIGMMERRKGKSVVGEHNPSMPEEDITRIKLIVNIHRIDEIENFIGKHQQQSCTENTGNPEAKQEQQPCTGGIKNLEGVKECTDDIKNLDLEGEQKQQPCLDDKLKNLKGKEQQQDKRQGSACTTLKPAYYYVSACLVNLVDGEYCVRETDDRFKWKGRLIRWIPADIQFDIDYVKIHQSVLKLEVVRRCSKGDRHFPYEDVGTSNGTLVVGRTEIPLSKFLQGDLNKSLSESLSGDRNRSTCVQLVKMVGSDVKDEGVLQLYMTVNKVIKPGKRSFRKALYDNTLGWLSGSTSSTASTSSDFRRDLLYHWL